MLCRTKTSNRWASLRHRPTRTTPTWCGYLTFFDRTMYQLLLSIITLALAFS